MTSLLRIVTTKEAAHMAATQVYAQAQALIADGKRVKITCAEDDDPKTVKQLRFIHGPLLEQCSEQARDNGQRYTKDVWKLYLKNLLLEQKPRYRMVKLPGQKRATPQRWRWSLRELGVKRCSQFIDEAIAHMATEWGVVFRFQAEEREEVRYREPKRAQRREAVAA